MEVLVLKPEDVVVEERARKDLGAVEELAESIKRFGQLHPITVVRKDHEWVLVAGERRLRACALLGIPVHAVNKNALSPQDAMLLELRENLDRKELAPLERARAIAAYHEAMRQSQSDWSYRDSAKALGLSAASISDAINIARGVEELQLEERLDVSKLNHTSLRNAVRRSERAARLVRAVQQHLHGRGNAPAMERITFHCADCFSLPIEEPFDMILTDPPYGMQYTNHSKSKVTGNVLGTHYKDEAPIDGDRLMSMCYSALKDTGILITFCNFDHFPEWKAAARRAGFKYVFDAPIIWISPISATCNPHIYPGSGCECAILALRENAMLQKQGRHNWFMAKEISPSDRIHPTEKLPEVLLYLLEWACPPGGSIYDPFAGSGSTLRAAFSYGCSRIVGCEINPETHKLAMAKLMKHIEEELGCQEKSPQ